VVEADQTDEVYEIRSCLSMCNSLFADIANSRRQG
jgi:hypothetical protein